MKKYTLLLLLFVIPISVDAQVGYLGKRFSLLVGTSFSAPMANNIYAKGGAFYDWSLLPSKVDLEIGWTVSEQLHVSLVVGYKGLQNSGYMNTYSESSLTATDFYLDSFIMQSNSLSIGLDAKFYLEYSPIGKYVLFGGGLSRTSSEVFPTYIRINENHSINASTTSAIKEKPGIYTTNSIYINLGIGQTKILSKKTIVDYGVKTSIYIGSSINPRGVDYKSYQSSFPGIIDFIVMGNLHSSSIIEIYFKIGLGV